MRLPVHKVTFLVDYTENGLKDAIWRVTESPQRWAYRYLPG